MNICFVKYVKILLKYSLFLICLNLKYKSHIIVFYVQKHNYKIKQLLIIVCYIIIQEGYDNKINIEVEKYEESFT